MRRQGPPLIAALLATTVVVSTVLVWLGWRLHDQQRALDEQRADSRLESTADALAATAAGRLAEIGERLSTWLSDQSGQPAAVESAAVVLVAPNRVTVTPKGALPFVPVLPAMESARADVLADAEVLELREQRLSDAAVRYRGFAKHPSSRVRAEALARLGAVLRKNGDSRGALEAYRTLAVIGDIRVGGLPAELAAWTGQRAAMETLGDRQGLQRIEADLVDGLDRGRWPLPRGTAEYYRDEFTTIPRPPSWRLATALDSVWREVDVAASRRGLRIVDSAPNAVLVLWRSSGGQTAILASLADRFFTPINSEAVGWRLTDPDGQVLAGTAAVPSRSVARVVGGADLPMTLNVWNLAAPAVDDSRRYLLASMVGAMLLFLWTATYFIVRAIRREARVAQLQTDFVAAVSHEFRSPLTTVRQMAEMLEMGRITSDERRHTYYRSLATEAARLQHLVETLLNFGRMEAGAAQYRLSTVALARVVDTIVRELEPQLRECGKQIEVSGPAGAAVDADESALTMALRNVVDNAIKYSPGQPTIWIRWADEGDRVAISVIDRGVGIPRSEHDAIFGKFVRGRAAIAASIKGTGVGLSMVRQIVMAHGGDIRLDSETGKGSTFTIVLRRAVPETLLNSSPVSGMERAL